ncbi:MAG: dimethyl sulfoxide reductase anchor subunit family protein, partial [Alphaproteobacteria bacterium]
MRPAYSIILFTTLSGLGYGLLALFGLSAAAGILPAGHPPDILLGLAGPGLALGLIVAGLLSSTFHLGHPERAWRALSQWRSSWLSREGVLALATFAPAGAFAIGWIVFGSLSGAWAWCGVLAAVGAALTVYCTAMIYASIRAVPRWHTVWVPLNYLSLALMTGAMWFAALLAAFGRESPAAGMLAVGSVVLAWALKVA